MVNVKKHAINMPYTVFPTEKAMLLLDKQIIKKTASELSIDILKTG